MTLHELVTGRLLPTGALVSSLAFILAIVLH